MELSSRPRLTAGIALTAAALSVSPLLASPAALHAPALTDLPSVSVPQVRLAAVVNPQDIDDLVNRLNSALASVSSTVNSAVAFPGNNLTAALQSAASVYNSLWEGLLDATDNRALRDLLNALRATSSGGLGRLSTTIGDVGDALVLTTGEVTNLLASTLTGSLSTALHAVAAVVNNPLALSSYTGLLNVPLNIAGQVLTDGLSLVNSVGGGALSVTSNLVIGVTAQLDNILRGVNGILGAAKEVVPGVALIDGVLTAIQGIVSAPVTAALAGVNGLTSTLSDAAGRALGNLTHGGAELVSAWLGNGASGGALQRAINAIGSEPLSVASYARALGVVVGAGLGTVNAVAGTASGLLSVPFSAGADLTSTATAMITKFNDGVATAASGILRAAGLPSFIVGLPHAVAATVNIAVRAVAATVSAGLNTVAAVLDIGSVTGTSINSVPRQAFSTTLVDTSAVADSSSMPSARGGTRVDATDDQKSGSSGLTVAPAVSEVASAEPISDTTASADTGQAAAQNADTPTDLITTEVPATGEADIEDVGKAAESAAAEVAVSDEIAVSDEVDGGENEKDADDSEDATESAVTGGPAGEKRPAPASRERAALGTQDNESGDDEGNPESGSYGRHASGKAAEESSSTNPGRHRNDSAAVSDSSAASGADTGFSGKDAGRAAA